MLSINKEEFDQKVENLLDRLLFLKYGSIAFSAINLIDMLTTVIGLDLGLSESNFPMYVLIELFGELGFIVFKIGISIVILLPLLCLHKKKNIHINAILVGVGFGSIIVFFLILIVVINNIYLILEKI
jgi:hypothetical protein